MGLSSKMKTKWIWTVSEELSKAFPRADTLISTALEKELGTWVPSKPDVIFTRNKLQKLILDHQVLSHQKPITSKQTLSAGTPIEISYEVRLNSIEPNFSVPLEILFEDEDLVVINKPPGLTVHPSSTQTENTLVHALLGKISKLSSVGGPLRPGIVHRLDKNTSGAMVISKSDRAHHELVKTFSEHSIERTYWALVYGAFSNVETRRVDTFIGRNPKDRKKMTVLPRGGKRAITQIKVIEKFGNSPFFASWIEAKLETGRTHQVRVHLTHLGHSLLGDPVYGTPSSQSHKWKSLPEEVKNLVQKLPGQALHARSLGFVHPITQQQLRFEAQPPPTFTDLLEKLKKCKA